MMRVVFSLKFNANNVVEASDRGTQMIAEFLGIELEDVATRVNTELKVERYERKDDDGEPGDYLVTVVGQLKNGFVFTPATN